MNGENNRVEKVFEFVHALCLCPCCQEYQSCSDGCTFETDAPHDYEFMMEARSVYFDSTLQQLKDSEQ